MGDSIKDVKTGDIIQVLGGKDHISMHIVVDHYIEKGCDVHGLKDEKMVSTYAFYCHDSTTDHMEINKIWHMPLENYLLRSPDHELRILYSDKD